MLRRLFAATLLFFSCFFVSSTALAQRAGGALSGQVVDADSGAPIAGAAVVAVWIQYVPAPHPVERFYDAREAVTDAQGRFEIARPVGSYLPLGVALSEITAFAPGYAKREVVFRSPESLGPSETVALKRLATRRERRGRELVPPWRIPDERALDFVPNFVRLLNRERRYLWMELYGKPTGTREDCPDRPLSLPSGAPRIQIVTKKPNTETAVIQMAGGQRHEVRVGSEVPGLGRVKSLDDRRMVVERILTEEETDALYCRGAVPVEAQEMVIRVLVLPDTSPSAGPKQSMPRPGALTW